VAEVQARIQRLQETRQLVAQTQEVIEKLQGQMGALANNPQMEQRAAAALAQARLRLQAGQQQVVELECGIPPGVVWDHRTGVVQEVRDAEGLSRDLGNSAAALRGASRGGGPAHGQAQSNGHVVAGGGANGAAWLNGMGPNGAESSEAVSRYVAAAPAAALGPRLQNILTGADDGVQHRSGGDST
jgi:hypothetical protein